MPRQTALLTEVKRLPIGAGLRFGGLTQKALPASQPHPRSLVNGVYPIRANGPSCSKRRNNPRLPLFPDDEEPPSWPWINEEGTPGDWQGSQHVACFPKESFRSYRRAELIAAEIGGGSSVDHKGLKSSTLVNVYGGARV